MAYVYFYKAMPGQTGKGRSKEQQGSIEASSKQHAIELLREQGLYITEIKLSDGLEDPFSKKDYFQWLRPGYFAKIKPHDLATYFRQMSLMLQSGSSLIEAIDTNSKLTEKRRLAQASMRMGDNIKSGSNFSAAMRKEEKIFGDFLPKMIESGESSGELDVVMERLADDLESKAEIRRTLVSAMIYPTILIIVTVGVITYLLISIIPKFATFLIRQGADLPWSTQLMLDMSVFMQDNIKIIAAIAFGTLFSIFAFYTTKTGKMVIDNILVRTPVIGKSITAATMAQAGWTMAILLSSGLTILDSIDAAKQLIKNQAYHKTFSVAAERISLGGSLTASFNQKLMPVMMQHMVTVGEKTGELDQVMMQLAAFYRDELRARIKLMSEMIQPALTVIIGGTVGFVYISFFSAMLKVSTGGQ